MERVMLSQPGTISRVEMMSRSLSPFSNAGIIYAYLTESQFFPTFVYTFGMRIEPYNPESEGMWR